MNSIPSALNCLFRHNLPSCPSGSQYRWCLATRCWCSIGPIAGSVVACCPTKIRFCKWTIYCVVGITFLSTIVPLTNISFSCKTCIPFAKIRRSWPRSQNLEPFAIVRKKFWVWVTFWAKLALGTDRLWWGCCKTKTTSIETGTTTIRSTANIRPNTL